MERDSFVDQVLKAKLTDRATQVRFLRFIASGLAVMFTQVGTLALLARCWSNSAAFIGSYALAVVVHYSLNRFWALRSSRTDHAKQTGEYALTVAGSFVVNFCLFQVGLRFFHLTPAWAALVTNPPTTLIVFLMLNFRVFRA
jgi:putative flippase GtrA